MRRLVMLLIGCLVLAALVGCSDKQKEAAKLEQEIKDMEGTDTGTEQEAVVEDTLVAEMPTADASAVPDETEPAPPPMPPAPRGEGYTVQVASCESEDYARHLVDVYTGRGYEPFVTTITYEGQTYYRVRIGSFDGFSEARAVQNELNDRYSLNSWIDRLDQ
jgi:cell division septation protein DedD